MTAMTLRVARQRNVLLAFVAASMVASLFLLSQTHSRLRRVQEDADKCHQKHDSLAAQLTVLYEHKARLEKTLEAEIERKKLVDDELKTMQAALLKEKVSQKEKYSKLLRDYDEHKTQQAAELSKLKATFESLRGDKEKLDAEVDELNIQAEKLRDTNHKLEEEVRKMQQSQPIDMNEVARLRERVQQCDAGGDFSGTHTSSLSSSTSASVHQGAAPAAAGIESAVPAELNNQPLLSGSLRDEPGQSKPSIVVDHNVAMAVLPPPQGAFGAAEAFAARGLSSTPRNTLVADGAQLSNLKLAGEGLFAGKSVAPPVVRDSKRARDGVAAGVGGGGSHDGVGSEPLAQDAHLVLGGGEDRDYQANLKDDDGGVDDDVDADFNEKRDINDQDKADDKKRENGGFDENNNNLNNDFEDNNVNAAINIDMSRGIRAQPK